MKSNQKYLPILSLGHCRKIIIRVGAASTPTCGSGAVVTGTGRAYWTYILFSAMALLLIAMLSLANPTILHAQSDLPPGAVIFDFKSSNGQPLERGQIVSSVTVDDLTMAIHVDSNGNNDVGMIFDTNNPGPDPDLGTPNQDCPGGGPGEGDGGKPGTIGENCVALGNVLIIPRNVFPGAEPNDDNAGGMISLVFDEPVRVVEIHILDIDEEGSAPLISFWDPDGNPTLQEIRPQVVGDNGHEKFSDFPAIAAASVVTIDVTFPGSGALDSIIVAPANPVGDIDIIKYVNGIDANDPADPTVPRFAPGEPVAWTYHVSNIGQIAYPKAEVMVTDSDPAVTPVFDEEISGNGDEVLDPDEVWAYLAVRGALDLQDPAGNPSVLSGICPSDNASLPPTNGYMNIGTVTVPDAEANDPAHYCSKDPGIAIRKFVNGNDANDPLGADVPRLAPGESVTWSYRVTNTGEIAYPIAQVIVTDSDAAVAPAFNQVLSGNDDQLLDPGEVWEYTAQSPALNLLTSGDNPSILPNSCPGSDTATPPNQNGYKNIGTVTVPDAEASDPAHYCSKEPGLLFRKFVNGNDANDPAGPDVPYFVPGEIIMWTYLVTNTGELPYAIEALNVTDNDPNVTPAFDKVLVGNDDQTLDPGEVWQYAASGEALDLRDFDDSPLVVSNGCIPLSDEEGGERTYRNIGSLVVPGAGNRDDGAHYCNIIPNLKAGRTEQFALTYTVVNDGPVAVENVQVFAGPNVTVTCPATVLAPGESMICPATATDIGFRNSVGWVVAQPVGGGTPLIRVVAPDNAADWSLGITINGQAAGVPSGPTADRGTAQGTAALAITVANTGNTSLNEIQVGVADQDLSCEQTALAPNEATVCTLTINVTSGPQVLIGGVSAKVADGGTALMQEVRVYLIGEDGP